VRGLRGHLPHGRAATEGNSSQLLPTNHSRHARKRQQAGAGQRTPDFSALRRKLWLVVLSDVPSTVQEVD